jgi:hypothetical protein
METCVCLACPPKRSLVSTLSGVLEDRDTLTELCAQTIHRAANRCATALQYVGVYLRGFHILVSEHLLDGADVVARRQQVRREAMPAMSLTT